MSSVLDQSFRDIELIVVDDASSEDVEGAVRRVADPRLRFVRRLRNGGAGAARNTGLALARGAFIGFQDSDDVWLPGKLERQLRLFAELPGDVGVVTGKKILYGRGNDGVYGVGRVSIAPDPTRPLPLEGDQVGYLLKENRLSVQNALFKSDCYASRTWFDERLRANEDWEFAIRLAQHTRIYEDPDPVVLGFVSSDSISRNSRRQDLGIVQVLRTNRLLLRKHALQHAALRVDLARGLLSAGKRRMAMRQMMASLSLHPLPFFSAFASKAMRAALRR